MKQLNCVRCGAEVDKPILKKPEFFVVRTYTNEIMNLCLGCRIDLINFLFDNKLAKREQKMTNERTIDILQNLWCYQKSEIYSDKEIREAIDNAIEAVKMNTDVDFDKVREQFKGVNNDEV